MDNRYKRQVGLPEIGEDGQNRLASAKAAVIGAGGLGSPVLYYLAAAGVGRITIIDHDTVDITNLNRQILHFEDDLGREKAQSSKEKLQRFNRDIRINASTFKLTEDNAWELLSGHDMAISCLDNNMARCILNAACIKSGIPMVNGGVQGFEGYVMVVLPGITPCYQCIFPGYGANERQGTEEVSVLGATAGVVGSMMAVEAIKVLLGVPISPYFYYIDLMTSAIVPVGAKKADDCTVCGEI